jgi:hypothetical protein
MHAYASDDPVFQAMNRRGQRETGGALGGFCVNCHAPMAVREGATADGLNLDAVPAKLKGVTCFFCHTVDDVTGTHDDPLHLSTEPTLRGGLQEPFATTAHRAAYSTLHDRDQVTSAALCGACHDVVTQHGAALERTFAEWQASAFSTAGAGSTCGQCHMNQSTQPVQVAQVQGAPLRNAHSHAFPGLDVALIGFPEQDMQRREVQEQLDSVLQTALCVSDSGGIRVLADNVAAGHGFPSGAAQDRRLWFEVAAYQNGQTAPFYASGRVDAGASVVTVADSDLWLLRDCIFDAQGAPLSMFWPAASFESNALPAPLTFDPSDPRYAQTHRVQQFPRGGGALARPDRVTLSVHVQPIGRDVLDDLVASGDLDAGIAAQAATLDVGAALEWTQAAATAGYLEDRSLVRCVTGTHFNVTADKVAAVNHARCAP